MRPGRRRWEQLRWLVIAAISDTVPPLIDPGFDLSSRQYTDLQGLHVLRGFAALSVLLFHCVHVAPWPSFPQHGPLVWFRLGGFGVPIFFALSGFVVTQAALRELKTQPERARFAFMLKRIARIAPLYLLTSALFLALVDSGALRGADALFQALTHLTFTHSLFVGTINSINGPTWSIGVEFQLYLLVALLMPWLPRMRPWLVASICIVIPLLYRGGVYVFQRDVLAMPFTDFRYWVASVQVPGSVDAFGVGAAMALAHARAEKCRHWPSWWLPVFAMVAVLTVFTSLILRFAPPYLWSNFSWSVLLLSSAAAMAIALLALAVRLPNAGVSRAHRPFIYLGTISYGVYLWHVPVLTLLKRHTMLEQGWLALAAVSMTLVLAAWSWHCLEQPAIAWARRYLRRRAPTRAKAFDPAA